MKRNCYLFIASLVIVFSLGSLIFNQSDRRALAVTGNLYDLRAKVGEDLDYSVDNYTGKTTFISKGKESVPQCCRFCYRVGFGSSLW